MFIAQRSQLQHKFDKGLLQITFTQRGKGQIKAILCNLFGCEVNNIEGDGVKKYCNYAHAIYVHSLKEFFLPCGPWMDSSGIWKAWWCMPENSPDKGSEY